MFFYHFVSCAKISTVTQLLQLAEQTLVFLSEAPELVCFDHCVSVALTGWDVALTSRPDWASSSIASFEQLIIVSLVTLKNIAFHVVRVDLVAIFVHTLSAVAHLNVNKL